MNSLLKYVMLFLAFFLLTISCEYSVVQEENPEIDCGDFSHKRLTSTDTVGNYYYVTEVKIVPFDVYKRDSISQIVTCRVFKNQVSFAVSANFIALDSLEIKSIPNVRGDITPGSLVNPTVWDKRSFRLSKDIYYRGKLIKAKENLLDHVPEKYPTLYFPLQPYPFAIHHISINKEDFIFPSGRCTVTAEWLTTDNKILKDTVDVYFELR